MQHVFLFPANLAIKLGTCPSRRHKQSRGEIQMSPPHSPRFNPPQVQPHLILPHTALSAAWPGLISDPEPLSSMKRRTAGTCRLSRREANHNAVKWVRRPANLGQANAAVTCLEIKAQARKVLRDSNHVFLFFFLNHVKVRKLSKEIDHFKGESVCTSIGLADAATSATIQLGSALRKPPGRSLAERLPTMSGEPQA